MGGLFGLSASGKIDPAICMTLLKPHGYDIHDFADGWGIAVFNGKASRLLKETRPFARTAHLTRFGGEAFLSRIVLAHINKLEQSQNNPSIADIQPFERELGGRSWVFAHDGALTERMDLALCGFRPIGGTSSERAFCAILEVARPALPAEEGMSIDISRLAELLVHHISAINKFGLFNVLMSDGEHMFVHAHTVMYTLERDPWPGEAPFAATLVTSHPLTDEEGWQTLPSNSFTVFHNGRRILQMETEGEAQDTAWERQRAEAETVQHLRTEAEERWRQHCVQFGDAMKYDSG